MLSKLILHAYTLRNSYFLNILFNAYPPHHLIHFKIFNLVFLPCFWHKCIVKYLLKFSILYFLQKLLDKYFLAVSKICRCVFLECSSEVEQFAEFCLFFMKWMTLWVKIALPDICGHSYSLLVNCFFLCNAFCKRKCFNTHF